MTPTSGRVKYTRSFNSVKPWRVPPRRGLADPIPSRHEVGELAQQPLGWRVDGGVYLKRTVHQTHTPIVTRRLRRLVTLPPQHTLMGDPVNMEWAVGSERVAQMIQSDSHCDVDMIWLSTCSRHGGVT